MSHLQRILDEETICKSMNCGLYNVMDEEKKGINLDLTCFNVVSLKIYTMTNKNF